MAGPFASGKKTVSSTGTAEALTTTGTYARSITIIAIAANSGQVHVGDSGVSVTTNTGLDAGERLEITDLNGFDIGTIFIDVGTNDDGVDFYYVAS